MFAVLSSESRTGLSPVAVFGYHAHAKSLLAAAVATALTATLAQPIASVSEPSIEQTPAVAHLSKDAAATTRAAQALNSAPIYFEANRGQWGPSIRYAARGLRHSVAFGAQEALIYSNDRNTSAALRFRGANPAPTQEALQLTATKTNYLHGNDSSRWISGVDTYAKVAYRNIYPGIDVVFYGNQQELEYDFIVAPGADPSRIALEFRGTDSVRITDSGELAIAFAGETLMQRAPVIYQDIAGQRRYVQGRYIERNDHAIGFELAEYDQTAPLYIDPVVSYVAIVHSGTDADGDEISAMRVDADGNIYVAGTMCGMQSTLPISTNAVDTQVSGSCDAWVAKLDAQGTPQYISYVGGSQHDLALDIAIDAAGAMYLTGRTISTDFPQVTPAQAPTGLETGTGLTTMYDNIGDAFVTKLSPSGSAIVYSTFLGGSVYDLAYAIAIDAQGRAHVGGYTTSTDLPITADAVRSNVSDSMSTGTYGPYNRGEGFLFILNAPGNAIEYGTYFGGNDGDVIQDIELDKQGNIYLTGSTSSTNLATTPYAAQKTRGGASDAFVAKIARDQSSAGFTTYLGGPLSDAGYGLALDADGGAFVVGQSGGQFPKTGTTPTRAFLAKIGPHGEHNYTANAGGYLAQDVAIAPNGDVVVASYAYKDIYSPVTLVNPIQSQLLGDMDGVLTVFDPDTQAVTFSSYLGCGVAGGYYASDFLVGVGLDRAGNIYTGGVTSSPTFTGCHTATNGGTWPEKTIGPKTSSNTARMPLLIKVGSMLPQTDLAVALATSFGPIRSGVPYNYTATVTNLGAQTAERTVLSQALPQTLTLDSTSTTQGTCLLDAAHTLNCDLGTLAAGAAVTVTLNVTANTTGNVVTTANVTAGVNDSNSNNNNASVSISVQSANQSPIANAGGNQSVECAGEATPVMLNGSASSDPDGDDLSYTWSGPFGMQSGATVQVPFAYGSQQAVALLVDDNKGGTDSDQIMVSVVDTTPPELEAAANTTLEAQSAAGAAHQVSYTASDVCGGVNVALTGALDHYPIGSTTVTMTATDRGGNTSSDSTTISVQDTTPPSLTVPAAVSTEATAVLSAVAIGQANASDVVDPAPVVGNDAPASGFALGTTTVTWTATDKYHNQASKAQSVTVVDTTAPAIAIANSTLSVAATGAYTNVDLGNVTASDIFTPVALTNDAPVGGFAPGSSTVTYTARDPNGNVATATQTVQVQYVFGDYQPPLRQGGVYKLGRVIPVKIVLTYANGTPVTTAQPTLSVYTVSNSEVTGEPLDIASASSADTGTTLRYTGTGGEYIYNLDTSRVATGIYRLFVDVKDGSLPRVIDIALK